MKRIPHRMTQAFWTTSEVWATVDTRRGGLATRTWAETRAFCPDRAAPDPTGWRPNSPRKTTRRGSYLRRAGLLPLSLGFRSTQSPMMAPSSSTEPATTSPYTAVSSRLFPYNSTRKMATAKFHIRSPWHLITGISGQAGGKFMHWHPDSDSWEGGGGT